MYKALMEQSKKMMLGRRWSICFEGPDGSGKTTQIQKFTEGCNNSKKIKVINQVKFPTSVPNKEQSSSASFFVNDFHDNIEQKRVGADRLNFDLYDRSFFSTMMYQGVNHIYHGDTDFATIKVQRVFEYIKNAGVQPFKRYADNVLVINFLVSPQKLYKRILKREQSLRDTESYSIMQARWAADYTFLDADIPPFWDEAPEKMLNLKALWEWCKNKVAASLFLQQLDLGDSVYVINVYNDGDIDCLSEVLKLIAKIRVSELLQKTKEFDINLVNRPSKKELGFAQQQIQSGPPHRWEDELKQVCDIV